MKKLNCENYLERRQADEKKVELVEKFIDMIYKVHGLDFVRVNDAVLQKRGIDVVLNQDGKIFCIDEKFAIKHLDKMINTFGFELWSRNNYNHEGWFSSKSMLTTHYCLLWAVADEDFSKIKSYDMFIVSKEKIMNFAKESGYYSGIEQDFMHYWDNRKILERDERYYGLGNRENFRRYMRLDNGCKIVQSVSFYEQPINILIPKDVLAEMAERKFSYHTDF